MTATARIRDRVEPIGAPNPIGPIDLGRRGARTAIRAFDGSLDAVSARLAGAGLTSLFGSAPWVEALTATYGFRIEAATADHGSGSEAAILFCEIEDIRGRRIVSLPFSDFLDPLVDDPSDWTALVAPIMARGAPVRFRCLNNALPLADARFTKKEIALWHAVDLTRSADEMWGDLRDSAPRNIRKAERSGVVVRATSAVDDIRAFYRMHCHVRKSKYQLFAQPFRLFENLHASFAADDRLVLLLAEKDGTPIAGTLFLIAGDTLYYKFNASIDPVLRPNDLLVWSGMVAGRERGLAHLDFGLSDLEQPGLIRFKQKFATHERPITELRWSPPGFADARGDEVGKLLQKLTGILTAHDVADDVTVNVGNELYGYFC